MAPRADAIRNYRASASKESVVKEQVNGSTMCALNPVEVMVELKSSFIAIAMKVSECQGDSSRTTFLTQCQLEAFFDLPVSPT